MSGIVSMIAIDKATGSHVLGGLTGADAADATKEAANTSAAAQMQQLNYLKEINAMPQQYKEQALAKLNALYGGGDAGAGVQQGLIDQAKTSPMYTELMGGLKQGENAILRNASATGGLRSGNTNMALADYGTQLSNQALTSSYNQQLSGLSGLAGLPTNEAQIGNTMAGIGATRAAGIAGAAQANQAGMQNLLNTGLGIVGLGIKAASI
jgi:hypothetical protein